MPNAKVLPNYFKVIEGKQKPRFKLLKDKELDDKVTSCNEILKSCELCERRCHINRVKGELGFCRAGLKWRIFGAHSHYGEEKELVPSATLFLAGCTMRCVYCQNAPQSVSPELGEEWANEEVAEWIDKKAEEGCKNVNFVTPDCYVWNILKALKLVKADIPVVWNSSSYYSEKTAELIKGVVDVYLLDFRYFNEKCAIKLSSAPNYPSVAKRNHLIANKDAELLIRVLVIPGHIECDAKPILKWIRDNIGKDVRVNIMEQYYPTFFAYKFPEINRRLTLAEYEDVVNYAKEIGLKNLVKS